jgi:hypothetical protein
MPTPLLIARTEALIFGGWGQRSGASHGRLR